jgi:hypothetical protein
MYIYLYDARVLVLDSVDFLKGLLSKVHRYFKSVSCEVHAFFSTFLYYLRDFGNDLVNSFELCRAYMSFKLKGGLYDLNKKMKLLGNFK